MYLIDCLTVSEVSILIVLHVYFSLCFFFTYISSINHSKAKHGRRSTQFCWTMLDNGYFTDTQRLAFVSEYPPTNIHRKHKNYFSGTFTVSSIFQRPKQTTPEVKAMFFLQLIDWKSSLAAPRVHCPSIFGSFVRKYLLSSRRIFTIFSDGRIFEHIEPILGGTSRESSGLPAASYRLTHHQIFHHNISSSNISSPCVISAKNKIRMGTSWMGWLCLNPGLSPQFSRPPPPPSLSNVGQK